MSATEIHEHNVITLTYPPGRGNDLALARWTCLPEGECTERDGDVTAIFGRPLAGRNDAIAPFDCLTCGRYRVHVLVTDKRVIFYCDKCGAREWDCDILEHSNARGPHPQKARAWCEGMGIG